MCWTGYAFKLTSLYITLRVPAQNTRTESPPQRTDARGDPGAKCSKLPDFRSSGLRTVGFGDSGKCADSVLGVVENAMVLAPRGLTVLNGEDGKLIDSWRWKAVRCFVRTSFRRWTKILSLSKSAICAALSENLEAHGICALRRSTCSDMSSARKMSSSNTSLPTLVRFEAMPARVLTRRGRRSVL